MCATCKGNGKWLRRPGWRPYFRQWQRYNLTPPKKTTILLDTYKESLLEYLVTNRDHYPTIKNYLVYYYASSPNSRYDKYLTGRPAQITTMQPQSMVHETMRGYLACPRINFPMDLGNVICYDF